ncbi:MAG: ABC transporter ATP-binding protein [Desulfobacteraceae bacterium]|nr:ABC transporter ATP-binding protein [Desulfobacteraceae bacterium]MBC2753116.1 ABC transporter ATP-binding protein [Desulfobacteraceae bacterium]
MTGDHPLIRLERLSKAFGPIYANREITLDIHAGKIKSLLGENGAGKSTLMGMLAGRLHPDGGRILIDGRPRLFGSARDAIDEGIGMVYQHFMLVEAMTVAENIFLGHAGGLRLKTEEMERQVADLARDVRLDIDPAARVATLSMGEKQRVEILKLLFRRNRVLIFDEPTAVLTPQEAQQLFEALRRMARQGKAIVFISHKLDEVMALSDEIAVLRKGEIVADMPAAEVQTKEDLARLMVGRAVILQVKRQPQETRQTVLRVQGLNDKPLKDIRLTVRQGEILGLVGVAGNGQKPLVETICGLRRPQTGQVRLMGKDWSHFHSDRRWDGNLSYIPEDRQSLATCRYLSLTDNFLLTTRQGFCRGPWLQRGKAEKRLRELIQDFDIQPPDPRAEARQLSGGNLQKMVLAREFFRRPRLIVAEQPTQGLDIAATEDVWQVLLKARERAGILLVTGDLAEALSLSDRLAVMFNGRIVDTFEADNQSKIDRIGLLMAGVTDQPAEPAPVHVT